MFIGKFTDNLHGMVTNDDNFTCCFEGVLYNKKRTELTDKQYIESLYREQGENSFSQLDGSFTFIIKDNNRTIIVRDHHGTGSQIYFNDSHFASSLSQLLETESCSTKTNDKALASFLSVGYIPTGSSSFDGVQKLGAGSMLIFEDNRQRIVNLFDTSKIVPVRGGKFDLETASRQYGYLHEQAIKRRIGESRNVGILLSGGYDSGSNLSALRRVYSGDINSYSIGFKGDNWSELPLAKCMSEEFGTIHHQYEIDGSEVMALPAIVRELGDPFVEGGLMVNYAAMKMIGTDKPDVILGGDGSDQYFGTSGREVAIHYLAAKYGMKPLLKLIHNTLSSSQFEKNNTPYRVRFQLSKILNIMDGDMFGFEPFMLKKLLRERVSMPIKSEIKIDTSNFNNLYTQHAYVSDLEKIINQVILFKASKMAAMFDNKIAFPYMDLELYKFMQQLPVEFKCKGDSPLQIARGNTTAKFLLKYHYKPMLPEAITSKKKQGGFAPMPIFFKDKTQRNRLADFIMESAVTTEFLNRDTVEKFVKTYDSEADIDGHWFWYKQNKAIQYFNLLTLAIWWEQYVNGNKNVTL